MLLPCPGFSPPLPALFADIQPYPGLCWSLPSLGCLRDSACSVWVTNKELWFEGVCLPHYSSCLSPYCPCGATFPCREPTTPC